jgi:hypothetical protein
MHTVRVASSDTSCPGYPEDDSHREETPPPEYPATDPEEAPPPDYHHTVLDETTPPDYYDLFVTPRILPIPGRSKMSCQKSRKTACAENFQLVDFTQVSMYCTEKKTKIYHCSFILDPTLIHGKVAKMSQLKLIEWSKDKLFDMVEEGNHCVYSQPKIAKTPELFLRLPGVLELRPKNMAEMSISPPRYSNLSFFDHQSPPSREMTLLSLMSSTSLHEKDEKVSSNVHSLPGPTVCQGNNEDGQVLWPESNITSQNSIHNDLNIVIGYCYGGTDRAKANAFNNGLCFEELPTLSPLGPSLKGCKVLLSVS